MGTKADSVHGLHLPYINFPCSRNLVRTVDAKRSRNSLYYSVRSWSVLILISAQFFFNFGPNSTTFIIPAEAFPTAVRSTGHGISAASGKLGAIIAAQCFSLLSKSSIGLQGVLIIFSGCCFLGLLFTLWVPETKGKTLEELENRS